MITNNGTLIKIDEDKIPTGFSIPAVTVFNDYERSYSDPANPGRPLIFEVDRDTVNTSDEVTNFGNIFSDAVVGVTKQITDFLTAEYAGLTGDVEAYAVATDITTNENDLYKNTPIVYRVYIRIYDKITV